MKRAFYLPIRPSMQFRNGPSVLQSRMAKINPEWQELHKILFFLRNSEAIPDSRKDKSNAPKDT